MIQLILKLALVAEKLFLIGFIGQSKVIIFNKVEICQNRLSLKTSK